MTPASWNSFAGSDLESLPLVSLIFPGPLIHFAVPGFRWLDEPIALFAVLAFQCRQDERKTQTVDSFTAVGRTALVRCPEGNCDSALDLTRLA
jgi:hypothetical protein